MKTKLIVALYILLFYLVYPGSVLSEFSKSIRALGRAKSTITKSEIRLDDIAEIKSSTSSDNDAIVALKNIFIAKSPVPGEELTLSAAEVLEKLDYAGVDTNRIAYVFPRVFVVRRASRKLSLREITSAIQGYFDREGREVSVKRVDGFYDMNVEPLATDIKALPLSIPKSGLTTFKISVNGPEVEEKAFNINAEIDEWREVPVASRALGRGEIVSDGDIMMARLNIGALPKDTILQEQRVFGRQTKKPISYGESFSKRKIEIPPLISTGSKVTVVYRKGALEASATGIALEDGLMGESIKVRNDSSKRVVTGEIVDLGLVELR